MYPGRLPGRIVLDGLTAVPAHRFNGVTPPRPRSVRPGSGQGGGDAVRTAQVGKLADLGVGGIEGDQIGLPSALSRDGIDVEAGQSAPSGDRSRS